MRRPGLAVLITGVCLFGTLRLPVFAAEPERFDLVDGDRVVLLGNTFVEREIDEGYIETLLASLFPRQRITFRNLGWSGDTVSLQMRPLNFGGLEEHVRRQRPTVVFVSYGMNESFEGAAGLVRFVADYTAMLEMLEATGARLVVISPIRHEALGAPLPDPAEHNRSLEQYVKAIGKLAAEREHRFVDLYHGLGEVSTGGSRRLTENGIHLSSYGYWRAALEIAKQLGHGATLAPVKIQIDVAGQSATAEGTGLSDVVASRDAVRFRATDDVLPPATTPHARPLDERDAERHEGTRALRIAGLAAGRYVLKIDGRPAASATAAQWAQGVQLLGEVEREQTERLRETIAEKNRFFFYRWRAHNGEYIYGRRSERNSAGDGQGNAGNPTFPAEMQQLEALIAEKESEIAALAVPAQHTYELTPEEAK